MAGRILIVDDDRAITQSLARLLSRDEYFVGVTHSCEEAIFHLQNDPNYDLALLDVGLPGLDGFACCRKLRELGHRMPVIMLSGRNASMDKVTGLEVGADDYLTKPADPHELLARVRAQLRRSRDYNADSESLERIHIAEGFAIDRRNRDALVNGKRAQLTDREYELLLLLARHVGKALAKEWLYQEVWGCAPDLGIKVLAVYMRRLRQKVEADPDIPVFILTVRGFGYKLSSDH